MKYVGYSSQIVDLVGNPFISISCMACHRAEIKDIYQPRDQNATWYSLHVGGEFGVAGPTIKHLE